MPIIIGYMIGKVIGNLLVAIIGLLFKALCWALMAAGYVVKYAFIALEWVIGMMWATGRDWYRNYKLNANQG